LVRSAWRYSFTARFALVRDVENLAQVDVCPDFGPLWLQIAVQHFAEAVGADLILFLQGEQLGYAIVRQRAVALTSMAF